MIKSMLSEQTNIAQSDPGDHCGHVNVIDDVHEGDHFHYQAQVQVHQSRLGRG